MNAYPVPSVFAEETPNSSRPRTVRGVIPFARRYLAGVLFFSLSVVAQAGWFDPKPDYSNYDVPLYQQITDQIKVRIMTRLEDGKNTQDRYFIIPFAYQNKGNDPEFSHSFMTVIRVLAENKQPKLTAGLRKRTFKNVQFQAFNISWLPADFGTNPNLCVFKGFGARLVPEWNQCPPVQGRSFTLEETIKLGVSVKNAVCMWGPYEINKAGFDLGVKRLRLLEKGDIKYRADDRLTRENRTAINCFHAMAGLTELFPKGGLFGTGFKMWGINGTARVLIEYNESASFKGLILEPVDEKKDRFGFVYAPARDSRPYNPFKAAHAYHQ
ncbi:MAG: hypothetical protein V4584_02090 [Verrucomicrobiota bacterium]